MLTLFHVARILSIAGCAAVLGHWAWMAWGLLGALISLPVGMIVGAVVGQLPLVVCLHWMARRLARMSINALVDELHSPDCLIPNLILLELRRREYNIDHELGFLYSLLISDDVNRRLLGWAAVNSAFPEVVERCQGYRPLDGPAECRKQTAGLANMLNLNRPC